MIIGPNPAANSFTIYFNSHAKAPATISVFDELGHHIWNNTYSSTLDVMEDIDCSHWGNGIYFVKAEQGGKIYSMKILVQQ